MFKYFLIILFSLFCTFLVKTVTEKLQIFEVWNSRRISKEKKVRIGGVSFVTTFILALPYVSFTINDTYIWILIGLWVVFIGGLLDDLFDLKPIHKSAFDLAGASIAVFLGQLMINKIVMPFGITLHIPIVLNALLPIIWIIAVINIMNLIDGLDGLATGISIISLATIVFVSSLQSDLMMQSLSITLMLSLLGFLPLNWFPSKIIMGDCGSRSIGYLMGCISLVGFKNITFMSIIVPFLLLAIPILDTLIAIIRRKRRNVSFMVADNGHIHHRLFDHFNGSQVKAVLSIYFITFLFSVSAIIYTLSPLYGMLAILLSIIVTFIIFLKINLISSDLIRKNNEQKENSDKS